MSRRALLGRLGAGAALAVAAPRLVASTAPAAPGVIRLHRTESAYGPSPGAVAAMRDAVANGAGRYAEGDVETLRRAIAAAHDVAVDGVVVGAGSTALLRMAMEAFAGRARPLVAPWPTFDSLEAVAAAAGTPLVRVPLRADYAHDLDAMLARCDAGTGLVYLCSPNNPTGTLTRRRDLEAFIRALPAGVFVVVDEAYHDYVGDAADYVSFIDHPIDDPRVVVTRTFSKVHGLAGVRAGYAVAAPATARRLAAQAVPDGVSPIAVHAAAAALADAGHVRVAVTRNEDDRQEFVNQAISRMIRPVDSHTNFVLFNAGRPGAEVVEHFARHGIAIAGPIPGYDTFVRVSVGAPAAMREFWRVWDRLPGAGMHH
jgi:histidinol-phosphate aminotransferase